ALANRFGPRYGYYDPEVLQEWGSPKRASWDGLVSWAGRFHDWAGFEAAERAYKLEAAKVLTEALSALREGGDWLPLVKKGLSSNNLTPRQAVARFIDWCEANPDAAAA